MSKIQKTINVTQNPIYDIYTVTRCVNTLTPRIGEELKCSDIEVYIDNGFKVIITGKK